MIETKSYAFYPGYAIRYGGNNRFIQNCTPTLLAYTGDNKIAVASQEKERGNSMKDKKYVVRRLTPAQCGRLQGFPDGWCSKVPHSDTVQYKMWGNGMCLPVILYCEQGMVDVIKERRSREEN